MKIKLMVVMMAALATKGCADNRDRRQAQQQHPHQDHEEYPSCSNSRGVCVPYYLCRENSIVTDGSGLIDIMIRTHSHSGPISSSECTNFLDVCCENPLSPNTTTTPPPTPYVPSCGNRNPQGIDVEISGFQDNSAQFAEFPWMAAILKTVKVSGTELEIQQYECGGSLIHPSLVLTVAHCVVDTPPDKLTVRLGEWDTLRDYEPYSYQEREVFAIVFHPNYNKGGDLYNDYALLRLLTPADLTYNVDTICLSKNFDRDSCVVTGWGKDTFGEQGEFQHVLKKIELSVWDNERCQNALRTTRLGRYFSLDSSFVCGGGEVGKDACSGDGGSPLVCLDPYADRLVLTGMVAWGIGCGQPGIPGVYANVPFAYDWIIEQADFLLTKTQQTPGYDITYWDHYH